MKFEKIKFVKGEAVKFAHPKFKKELIDLGWIPESDKNKEKPVKKSKKEVKEESSK